MGRKVRPKGHSLSRKLVALSALLAVVVAGLLAFRFVHQEQPHLLRLPDKVAALDYAQGTVPLRFAQVPSTLVTALVDTEDQTFWTNIGVSFEGIVRSILVDVATGSFQEGGSTITQQLVRDQLLTPQKILMRKIKEMLLALWLTRLMSKREILTLYLNQVYLGHGAYGLAAAARVYFGVPVRQLSPAQCALLAGLPQAPTLYDPLLHPQAARQRQREVVSRMLQMRSISSAQAAAILAAPWHLR